VSQTPSLTSDEFFSFRYQSTRSMSGSEATVADIVTFVGQVASDRQDPGAGRAKISDYIRSSAPLAALEGRAQVLVLGAANHVVENGGMRGTPLAPVTLYEYFRLTLKRVQRALLNSDPEVMLTEEFWSVYQSVIHDPEVPESQRTKVAAMLEVFHRFLVIVGCAPLQKSLVTGSRVAPPAAAVVWQEELMAAIDYICAAPVSTEVMDQCVLGIRLGYHIPIRSYELWCIRVGDIRGQECVTLDIYPRRRDGVRKTSATRRQVVVTNRELAAFLLDMQRRRRERGASDEDVLLGDPARPDGRFEEALCTRLMNVALKVGTKNDSAGFHDLRHSAISRASIIVLQGGRFAA
jgi:hypothetical protein